MFVTLLDIIIFQFPPILRNSIDIRPERIWQPKQRSLSTRTERAGCGESG